tara:strand:- start:436 stop:738 length:303 start_codon:yes stop_codon:yes gene_type:complete
MKNSNTYFNTTDQDIDYVNKRKAKNKTQEVLVYDLFKSMTTLTASEVLTASETLNLFSNKVPITSIRRAISNLQKEEKLVKTTDTKTGIYGAPEHYYTIR